MKLTDKQKRLIWVGVLLIALTRFAPNILTAVHQAIASRQLEDSGNWKPSPARPALAAPSPIVQVPAPPAVYSLPDRPLVRALGTFIGAGFIPRRGLCRLGLETKLSGDKPGYYSGYSVLTCGPSLPFSGQRPTRENRMASFINQVSPVSTILSGPAVNGALELHVDKQIGSSPDGCAMNSFTVTPFGDRDVAVTWEAGPCPSGNMMLQRVGAAH